MLRDCGIPDDESKEEWAFRPGRVFAPVNQALVRDPFLFELKRTERCIRDIARVDADFRSPRQHHAARIPNGIGSRRRLNRDVALNFSGIERGLPFLFVPINTVT